MQSAIPDVDDNMQANKSATYSREENMCIAGEIRVQT